TIFIYHLNEMYKNGFIFLKSLGLDFSIILIPTMISLNKIIKIFKDDKNKLFSLLEELIMLRYDLSDIILKKNTKSLMIHPNIVKDIKGLMRYFDIKPEVDYIHYLIKTNEIWHIDDIIVQVLKLTKSYDGGKEYRRRGNELRGELDYIKTNLKIIKVDTEKEKDFRKKLTENLGMVLAYQVYGAGEKSYPVYLYYNANKMNS
ncbi:hypothetical protein LCGC14_1884830, partial [marine sediment metagenome]